MHHLWVNCKGVKDVHSGKVVGMIDRLVGEWREAKLDNGVGNEMG